MESLLSPSLFLEALYQNTYAVDRLSLFGRRTDRTRYSHKILSQQLIIELFTSIKTWEHFWAVFTLTLQVNWTLEHRERPTCPPYHLSHDKISRKNSVYIIIFVNTIPGEWGRETNRRQGKRESGVFRQSFDSQQSFYGRCKLVQG